MKALNSLIVVGVVALLALPAVAMKEEIKDATPVVTSDDGVVIMVGSNAFAGATVIAGVPYTDGPHSTVGATLETGESRPCGSIGATVWYTFTPAATGTYTLDTIGSNFDTVAAVRLSSVGLGGASIACNDDASGLGLLSRVSWTGTAGVSYHLQLGGFASRTGNLKVNLAFTPPCVPPANDNQAAATPFTTAPYTNTVNTTCATTQPGEPTFSCSTGGAPVGKTAWWAFTVDALSAGPRSANTDGSSFDTVMQVWMVSPIDGTLSNVACDDDSGVGLNSAVTFVALPTVTYLIQAGSWNNGSGGNLILNVA